MLVEHPERNRLEGRSALRVVAVAAAVALAVAACSGGGSKKHTTTVMTVDAAKQYVALANPANRAAERFNAAVAALQHGAATQPQVVEQAALFSTALEDMNKGLAAGTWSPAVAPLVRQLAAANSTVIADLQRAGSVPAPQLAAWTHDLAVDEGRFTDVAIRIRVLLRLPPAEA